MKKTKALGIITLFLGLTLILTSCGTKTKDSSKTDVSKQDKKTEILVGTSPGPYSELFLKAVKPILEKDGYTVKEKNFDSLKYADEALQNGEIDLNVDQHTAYLNNFNKNTNGDLKGIVAIPTVPAAIFGGKKTKLDEIKKGDSVAIPDDPSNTARALLLLEKAGWIKLKDGIEVINAKASDVAENKYDIKLVEMNSSNIPPSLKDVDYAVIPGSIVYSASIDPNTALIREDVLKQYELVAAVVSKNADSDWAKAVVSAYKSEDFAKYLEKENKNGYWFIPEDLKK